MQGYAILDKRVVRSAATQEQLVTAIEVAVTCCIGIHLDIRSMTAYEERGKYFKEWVITDVKEYAHVYNIFWKTAKE